MNIQSVLEAQDLSANEQYLLMVIQHLTEKLGTDIHLAQFYGVSKLSKKQLTRALAGLHKKGYINYSTETCFATLAGRKPTVVKSDARMDDYQKRAVYFLKGSGVPLPEDEQIIKTLNIWRQRGVTLKRIGEAWSIAIDADKVAAEDKYRYFCGVVWNQVKAA